MVKPGERKNMKTIWQYHGFTIKKEYVADIDDGGKPYQYEVYQDGMLVSIEMTLSDAKFYCDNGYSL